MPIWGEALVALGLLVAVVGAVLPVIPGALLAWGLVLVWAWVEGTAAAWTTLILVTIVLLVGQVLKYLLPGRSLQRAELPSSVLIVGAVAALIGFFVIPVVGLVVGLVIGVWVATVARRRTWRGSAADPLIALRAVGVSIVIEAGSVIVATGVWAGGIWASTPPN